MSVSSHKVSTTTTTEPSIWTTRSVDWPIPVKLSSSTYQKLWQATVQIQQQQQHQQQSHGGLFAKVVNRPSPIVEAGGSSTTKSTTGTPATVKATNADVSASVGGGGTPSIAGSSGGGGDATFLTGFMSRVLGPTANAGAYSNQPTHPSSDSDSGSLDTQYYARPPRPGCVASSNGWIVATLECYPENFNNTTTNDNDLQSKSLRLVSRWNVRRANMSDQWIALPPPSLPQSQQQQQIDCRIRHVFVDPTASHTLLSAANGEAYYIHSSTAGGSSSAASVASTTGGPSASHQQSNHPVQIQTNNNTNRQVIKLAGFGITSTKPEWLTGVSATSVPNQTPIAAAVPPASLTSGQQYAPIQVGLSYGTYVTAVAWDRERGTEGSSKRILLGTSAGEIYEYSLTSAGSGSSGSTSNNESKHDDSFANAQQPVLLHKLYNNNISNSAQKMSSSHVDPSEVGAAVTGLYFERLRTGLLVIATTSGRHKRTRFYTFYSPHSSSFRMVLSASDQTLQELPGSVDCADLRLCNDHFALRTATGIFYGTIDRSLSGPAGLSGGGSMIIDSGILPYEILIPPNPNPLSSPKNQNHAKITPVSIALTPHHIVTLGDNNEVCFINRVAQKVIQRERIDNLAVNSNEYSSGHSDMSMFGFQGELLMDIRRPDQVWLRRARVLVHISPSQEDRDVWKFTLYKCLEMKSMNYMSQSTSSIDPAHVAHTAALFGAGHRQSSSRALNLLTEEEKTQEALFEQAKTLCTNVSQKSVVTAVRAEYHLSQGRGELGAKYLAQCPSSLKPFADTAIRLALPKLGIDDPQGYGTPKAWSCLERSNLPLITYLSDKMRIGSMNDDKMTCTMLGAWLTELYLNERSEQLISNNVGTTSHDADASQRVMLAQFLNANVNNMDARTIMKILTSHDVGASECASYASKSGDVAAAVNAALNTGPRDPQGAFEALRVLNDAPFELSEPLYYKHASTLLSLAPMAATEAFLTKYSQGLSPLRLLPSIMNFEKAKLARIRAKKAFDCHPSYRPSDSGGVEESKSTIDYVNLKESPDGFESRLELTSTYGGSSSLDDANVSITYLEGVIKQGCRNSAIFNYLVSLYANIEDEEPLYEFLTKHVPSTSTLINDQKKALMARDRTFVDIDEAALSPLDLSYSLRTVLGSGRHFRSAIKLYMGFGMRQQAVELALKVDPTLARQLAQDSVELEERKRLWLMIAKAAATGTSGSGGKDVVSRVVSVLRDCGPDVLSIEDVLPFLPDFAQIDQIKDEIGEALTSYSSKIESLMREMKNCDTMCSSLRDDVNRLRNHQMSMKADALCAFTHKSVLNAGEPFYVFPSGYVVLASALKSQVLPYINEKQRQRFLEIEDLLKVGGNPQPSRQSLQAEMDSLIAAECPLTGSLMIESIDRDFDDGNEAYDDFDVDRVDV